ncbi:MAG: putative lipid II flippase FtsW [Pseudomonadales bacterium]
MSMALKSKILPRFGCPVDPLVLGMSCLLLLTGLVMVTSASTEVSARIYGNPFHLASRHLVSVLIAAAAGGVAMSIPIKVWQKLDLPLLFIAFVLLVAVLIPGIGKEVNGASRWISLGFFTLQGSEFVKLIAIIYIAAYLVKRKEEIQQNWLAFIKPLIFVGTMSVLLLMQPDFGAAVVIMSAVMGVIFLAGSPMKYYLPVVSVGLVILGAIAVLQPYRLARLTSFTDPWQHPFGGGYQLTQALIAIGRGEWLGLGLGNSIQKLFFLPEAHTDFLFSIIAEELGVVGAVLIIVVFAILVVRALWIGKSAVEQGAEFHAFLAYGIAFLLGVQSSINLGVNLGLLPTKGLTLPLVSFGGNSLIISCVLIAILLRIEYECRNQMIGVIARSRRSVK